MSGRAGVALPRALVPALLGGLMGLLAAGCGPNVPLPGGPLAQASASPPPQVVTLTPLQPAPTGQGLTNPGPTPPDTPEPERLRLWVSPAFPAGLKEALNLPAEVDLAPEPGEADLVLGPGEGEPLTRWVYALVAPFPTIEDGLTARALRRAWQGDSDRPPLLMAADTRAVFAALWGEPGVGVVETLPAEELLEVAWDRQLAWAIVPFGALEPRWKVLEVDGQSPVRKDFDLHSYPLAVPMSLSGDPQLARSLAARYGPESARPLLPDGNRDPERLTVLVMTGVTALVRSTAWTMERNGITYPARDIGPWLREADITHISNEVPFAYDCPPPDPVQEELVFCSDPRYIELLEAVGTDVVELTGDHFQDWGAQAMLDTLALYRQRGWPYYGGGENLEAGRRPLILEHNGNRLAFIGCNGKGGFYASATEDRPGSVGCDYDYLETEIARLRAEGILPIATFQHFEQYTFTPPPGQMADFQRLAEAGAVIVSGSQAHQPQAMAFHQGAFIHYGLGNLFFDQLGFYPETYRAFIDRYTFHDGRLISVELLTTRFVDYALSRPMEANERREFLETIFAASGW